MHRVLGPVALRRSRDAAGLFLAQAKLKLGLFNRVKRFAGMTLKCKEAMHSFQHGCSLLRQAILEMFFDTFAYVVNESRPDFKSIPDLSRQREY